jgi:hypothetical protein
VIQANPFQFCPLGQLQDNKDELHILPPEQVIQVFPFQFDPDGHPQILLAAFQF